MRNIRPFLLPGLLVLACNVYAQSPGNISNQSVWLQGKISPEPVLYQTLNFHPAIGTDDSKSKKQLPRNLQSLRRVTIFTVYQAPASVEESPVWEMNGAFGDLALSTKQVSSLSANTSLVFIKNQTPKTEALIHTFFGSLQSTSSTENTPVNNFIRFGEQSGAISEFILFERILKEEEINKVESYLAVKYGITLRRNYINSSGDVVWNYKRDSLFSNNIAGIGRDDRSSLYQKQSTSSNAPGQLIIGVDSITSLNAKNKGQFVDRNYLLWGDNSGSMTLKEDPRVCNGEMLLPERKWIMKRTGNKSDEIATEVRIDAKAMFGDDFHTDNLFLIIDRTGTGEFLAENCIYIKPDNISNEGVASFKGVNWDIDGSGKDAFTFGIRPATKIVKGAPALVSFQLYPNPVTNGHYRVSITLDKPSDIEVRLYDMHQRLVQSRKASGQMSYVFPGTITGAAGAYTVKVITAQTEYSRIIIVQ